MVFLHPCRHHTYCIANLARYILRARMFHPIFGSGNLSRFIMSVALPAGVFVSVLHHLHTSDLWDLRYGMLAVTFNLWQLRIYRCFYHDDTEEITSR